MSVIGGDIRQMRG